MNIRINPSGTKAVLLFNSEVIALFDIASCTIDYAYSLVLPTLYAGANYTRDLISVLDTNQI
jgi:hypothetical protein